MRHFDAREFKSFAMNIESRLGFQAVWVDPAQDFERAFTLFYYPEDGDVELVR